MTHGWTIEQTGEERILCCWYTPQGGNLMKREVAVLCDWNTREDRIADEVTLLLRLNGMKESNLDDLKTWEGIGDSGTVPPAAPKSDVTTEVEAARNPEEKSLARERGDTQ